MRIKDVARAAGVSTATVSHVINNTRFVSVETRRKVQSAIESCNYYPNAQARSLASGKSNILGLLLSDISNPFFPELAKSVEEAAFKRGFDVILSNTNYDPSRASNYVRRLIERKVAGVALMTSELDSALIEELSDKQVPVVYLDLGPAGPRTSKLDVKYEMGIGEAVRYLENLGHSSIAYIGGPQRLRSASRRLEAFLNATGSTPGEKHTRNVFEGDFRLPSGSRIAQEILASSEQLPTAIIAANDMMALGVLQEFRAAGVSVPEEVSVIGFDDIAFAALASPALTTISLPRVELGRRAVDALIMSIEHPEQHGIELAIPTHLVIRDSTTRARTARVVSQISNLESNLKFQDEISKS